MYRDIRWNEVELNTLSESETGRYVLCEAKEDNTTRLFIHQFNRWVSVLTKEGWWDTFTLSKNPCKKGFYLCKIEEFRFDRNGYINMIVLPSKYLGESVDEDSIGWDYLASSGKLASHYKSRNCRERFNVVQLERVFAERFESSGYKYMTEFIFAAFIADKITLDELASALEEKYDIEKFAEEINRNLKNYEEKYPLFVKKLPVIENYYGYRNVRTTESTIEFLERKSREYYELKLGSETDMLAQVEAVLKYWVDFHKAKKAEKKASKAE